MQGYGQHEYEEEGAHDAPDDGHPLLGCKLLSVQLHDRKQQHRECTGQEEGHTAGYCCKHNNNRKVLLKILLWTWDINTPIANWSGELNFDGAAAS